ncbi:MAG: DUF4825 domain-containing protein, partial [Clostridia bacterium]|nr:DUF4825 domain-containing protein [Clostridia bacterium]
MDKKSRIITYVAIGVILIILIGIAIVTRISSEAPGLTAYSESGVTAQAIRGGYTWNSLLKSTTTDAPSPLDFDYDNENTLLVKPGEKVTFRNSGKDFDSYKFYQDEIKYYDKDNVETILTEEDAPINTESKSIVITAPEKDGTYIYSLSLNYHKNGNAQYGLKVVVSSIPSYQVESLLKYKNTYIGSAPTVGQLLNALPYSQYRDGMILRTSNKPYELIVYYKGLDVDKDSLFNNTVAIFALVDNVDVVTYELNDKSYV